MKRSKSAKQKRRRQPATGVTPIGLRLPEDVTMRLDQWAEKNQVTRSQAIRSFDVRPAKPERQIKGARLGQHATGQVAGPIRIRRGAATTKTATAERTEGVPRAACRCPLESEKLSGSRSC